MARCKHRQQEKASLQGEVNDPSEGVNSKGVIPGRNLGRDEVLLLCYTVVTEQKHTSSKDGPMPIHVTIALNERKLSSLHIARVSSSSSRLPNATYEYAVLAQETEPQSDAEWMEGVRFQHAYKDSIETCVLKALTALQEDGKI